MRRLLLAAAAAAGLSIPRPAYAQNAAELLERAYAAYQNLDLATAVGLIQRALASSAGDTSVTRAGRARALTVLAAAELIRDRRDSATSAFRQLVQAAPRYRPDPATFPPPVLLLFDDVRRAVKVAELVVPDSMEIRVGIGTIPVHGYASSVHDVIAQVIRGDGRLVRELYRGPLGDSLLFGWNGTDSAGTAPAGGLYYVTLVSLGPDGTKLRELRLPIEVDAWRRDTLPHPAPPADSLFKPERVARAPALRALAGGLLLGAGAAAMPSVIGGAGDATGTRFLVGVALSAAGVAGFVSRHPGRPIPGHIAHNDSVRSAWRTQADSVNAANRGLRVDVRLRIRARPAVRVDEAR